MAYRTATFDGQADYFRSGVTPGSGRRLLRALGVQLTLGIGAVATIAAVGGTVTLAAIWFVGSAGMTNPYAQTKITGPGRLALSGPDTGPTGAFQNNRFQNSWAKSPGTRLADGRPRIIDVPQSATIVAAKVAPVTVAALEPPVAAVAIKPVIPLPLMRPLPPHQELAKAPEPAPAPQPAAKPAPQQLAALAPPALPAAVEKRVAPPAIANPMGTLPDSVSRTAVYDITSATVYLPNGQKLEAHSGMYDKMDDPRHSKVRMRGVTPPNVYVLTERESLFHGVRALRLNPVDHGKMYGRDGILAHTYMLGPTGQSNGCVSFKNYDKFLQAFLDGKVDKLVVVGDLGNTSWRSAALQADGVNVPARRIASNGNRVRSRGFLPAIFGEPDAERDSQVLGYAPGDSAASSR